MLHPVPADPDEPFQVHLSSILFGDIMVPNLE